MGNLTEYIFNIVLTPILNVFDTEKSYIILKKEGKKVKAVSPTEGYPITILTTIILTFVPINGINNVPAILLLLYYGLLQKSFIMTIWSIVITVLIAVFLNLFDKLAPKYVELVSDTIFYYIPGSNPEVLGAIVLLLLLVLSIFIPFYILTNIPLWYMSSLIEKRFKEVAQYSSVRNVEEAFILYSDEDK